MTTAQPPEVVVIEDNRILGELIASRLRRCGYVVRVLTDGLAAADYLRQVVPTGCRPALILAELRMMGLSGVALLEIVRRARWTAPVILMRDARSMDLGGAGREHGAMMLSKPFDFAELEAVVTAAIEAQVVQRSAAAQ